MPELKEQCKQNATKWQQLPNKYRDTSQNAKKGSPDPPNPKHDFVRVHWQVPKTILRNPLIMANAHFQGAPKHYFSENAGMGCDGPRNKKMNE